MSDIIKKGPQYIQENSDQIDTLFATATPAITNGTAITTKVGSFIPTTFAKPADYHSFVSLRMVIDSVSRPAKPADYNEINEFMDSVFLQPTNDEPYYVATATGWTLYRGSTGSVGSANLVYLKTPATFVFGKPSQIINEGIGVLTTISTYIALETGTVHNGTTYNSGDSFSSGVVINLTSGSVILASNTTTCDLPAKVHETIAKLASSYMMGAISSFDKSAFVEKEASKS